MAFVINSVRDLLPLKATAQRPVAVDTLTPAELKDYDASASKFIDEFNAAYPDGKRIKVKVTRCNPIPNQLGRVAIVLDTNPDFNTQALTYPPTVADTLAQQLGMPSFGFLASQLANTSNDPSFIELEIKAVKKGDKYVKRDGTEATYKAHSVVTSDPIWHLSKSVLANLQAVTAEVDREEMLAMRRRVSSTPTPAPVAAVAHVDEDVLGG